MAKRIKTCAPKPIRFKTRRGRWVSFTGRSGGQIKNGGKCSNKARRKTAWMRTVGKAGKACARKGRPGTRTNTACLKAKLREAR